MLQTELILPSRKNKKYFLFAGFIILAIIAGLLFDLTKLIIFFKVSQSGAIYSGYSLEQPDALVMMPAWHDVLDGHWRSSDAMTYEYAGAPFLWPNFSNNLLLAPLIFLVPSVDYLYLVGYFLMGACLFVVFFWTLNLIVKNRAYSIVASYLLVAAGNIFYIVFPLTWEQIKLTVRAVTFLGSPPIQILGNRYESLSILPGFVPFSLTFLFIYFAINRPRRFWIIMAGIFSGALFYLFPSSAMYIWTVLGIIMLGFIFVKEFNGAKNVFWIILTAIAFSFLNWFNFLSLKFLPWSEKIFRTLGGEAGYSPRLGRHILEYLLYILFAAVIYKLAKYRGNKKIAIYLISFLVAPIILLNIQVVMGSTPFPHAWYVHQFYYGFALCWFVSFYWLYQILKEKYPKLKKVIIAAGVIFSIVLAGRAIQTNIYAADMYQGYSIPPATGSALHWLDGNTDIDSVVVSPAVTTNALVSIFTHNRVMLPYSITFVGSLGELIDRWMVVYKLYNVPADVFKNTLLQEKDFVYNNYFRDNRIDSYLTQNLAFEKEPERQSINDINNSREIYKKYPERLEYLLKQYKMDYFYIGPDERKIIGADFDAFDRYEWLDKVYDQEGVQIYKINHLKINSKINI